MGPSSLPPPKKGGGTAQFSAHVYFGQMVTHLSSCWALVCIYYRLEEPILRLLWGVMNRFFSYNFRKPELIWMKPGTKWGATVHTHTRKWGNPPGVPPKGTKTCFVFFCHQYKVTFQPLVLHRFRPFLKQKRWSTFCMRTEVKNCRISEQGAFQVPKTAKMGTVDGGVFVSEVQLKWHNFGWWESFWGLVDIPRMCLLYVCFCVGDVRFGRYKPTKNPNFGDRHAVDYIACWSAMA